MPASVGSLVKAQLVFLGPTRFGLAGQIRLGSFNGNYLYTGFGHTMDHVLMQWTVRVWESCLGANSIFHSLLLASIAHTTSGLGIPLCFGVTICT